MPASVETVRLELGGRPCIARVVWAPGPGKGQDRWQAADGIVAVADGATPLADQRDDPGALAAALLDRLRDSEPGPARRRLQGALDLVAAESSFADASSTLGAILETPAGLRAVVLGDCAVAWTRQGVTTDAEDLRLGRLDARALRALRRRLAHGVPPDEARAAIEPLLIANRGRLNSEGGYWVATGRPSGAARHAIVRVVPVDFDGLVVASDGFSRAWITFGLVDPAALVDMPPSQLVRLVADLRARELVEAGSPTFAQLSVSDDATAVIVKPA